MPDALRRTLVLAGAVMAGAREPWWVIASAAVALHGVAPIDLADVDVLLDPTDAEIILPRLGLATSPGEPSARFRSRVFARWTDPPLAVEFMAGFEAHDGLAWRAVAPRTRRAIMLDGVALFVPDAAELLAMLEGFGRPKDLRRADMLRRAIAAQTCCAG